VSNFSNDETIQIREGGNPNSRGSRANGCHFLLRDPHMQREDQVQFDFLTAAMPPDVWTLPAKLASVDRLLGDPSILAPLLSKLDPVWGRPPCRLRKFYVCFT